MTEAERTALIIAKSKVFLARMGFISGNGPLSKLVDAKAELERVTGNRQIVVGNEKVGPSPALRAVQDDSRKTKFVGEFTEPLFVKEQLWDDVILGKKAAVMSKIHELVKAEAEMSNALAMCEPASNQAGMCEQLVEGRKAIERHYDLWYYLDRNNALPPTPEDIMTTKEKEVAKRNDPDRATKLAVNKVALDSYRNIAQKAKSALKNIGNTTTDKFKRAENIEKLNLKIKSCEAEIKRLTAERECI